MKKNLLALAALGASIALLAGCASTTPDTSDIVDTGTVVETTTTTTTPDTSDVTVTGTTVETTTGTTAE